MNWHQRLDILRWRSLEEADAAAELLSVDKRREATARSRGDLRGDSEMSAAAIDEFVQRRTTWLGSQGNEARFREALATMIVPASRWSWALAGWLLALAVGFGLTGIGSEREINLLSLPLVGLLIWNAGVMIASVVFELGSKRREGDRSRFSYLDLRRGAADRKTPPAIHEETFRRYAEPLVRERTVSRFRAWLHVAAAVLALGSCAGMYAKGWSHEYRAVWESTLLKPKQAETFFSTLFWPASKTVSLAVPVQDIPKMQRTGGKVERPADALPWIHLYAATLLLLVVAPRLLIAAWTRGRGDRRVDQQWQSLGWDVNARRLLRSVEGGDEVVQVLLHGMANDDEHRSQWTRAIREKIGGMSRLEFLAISSGDEDEFAAEWVPQTHGVIALFQLATTPEAEVQRKLVADLRGKLHTRFADGRLTALLDVAGVLSRWTDEHIESRRQLWRQMLADVTDEIDFVGDDVAANRLRVPMSKAR